LLDSTVLIDALRGRRAATQVVTLRSERTEPWVCVISVDVVWRGIRPGEELAAWRLFWGLPLAPLGKAQGMMAGRCRREFAGRGLTLHQVDYLIAAAAVGVGAAFGTTGVRDDPMAAVDVRDWPAGQRY